MASAATAVAVQLPPPCPATITVNTLHSYFTTTASKRRLRAHVSDESTAPSTTVVEAFWDTAVDDEDDDGDDYKGIGAIDAEFDDSVIGALVGDGFVSSNKGIGAIDAEFDKFVSGGDFADDLVISSLPTLALRSRGVEGGSPADQAPGPVMDAIAPYKTSFSVSPADQLDAAFDDDGGGDDLQQRKNQRRRCAGRRG